MFPSQTNLHAFFLNLLFPCPIWSPLLPLSSLASPSSFVPFGLPFFLCPIWSPLLPLSYLVSPSSFVLFGLPFFLCPIWSPLLPLSFSLKIYCHSYDMTILSPLHMTIPMNTVCHGQLIYGFHQTLHEHQICRTFSVFELHSTHCSHPGSFCPL